MLHLDETSRKTLTALRRETRDKKIYVKLSALLMLDAQYPPVQIEKCSGIDVRTVYGYAKEFNKMDVSTLLGGSHLDFSGKLSEDQEVQTVKEEENLYWSARAAAAYILSVFGITYTDKGVVKLLHRSGFSYKRTQLVPAKANGASLKTMMQWLEFQHNTKLKYLHSYAPNLNLIDWLWKFIKKEVIHSFFHETIAAFRQCIVNFFRDIHQNKPALTTLITLNFRVGTVA
jgi:transposase